MPNCIINAASAGVATPPAAKLTTGSFPVVATSFTNSYGARNSFAATYNSSFVMDAKRLISPCTVRA